MLTRSATASRLSRRPVRVGEADEQEERFVAGVRDELPRLRRDLNRVAAAVGDLLGERVDLLRLDVQLGDDAGAIAGRVE